MEAGNCSFFNAILEEQLDVEVHSLSDPQLFTKIQNCSCVIVALSKLTNTLPHCELESNEEAILYGLAKSETPVVAVIFGTPYSVARLPLFSAIVVAYENEKEAQEAAAEVILGRRSPKGRLPVSVEPFFAVGTGLFW